MMKLRFRDAKWLAPDYTACKSGSWDLDTDGLTPDSIILVALLRDLSFFIHTILSDRMQIKERQNNSLALLTSVNSLRSFPLTRDTETLICSGGSIKQQ